MCRIFYLNRTTELESGLVDEKWEGGGGREEGGCW